MPKKTGRNALVRVAALHFVQQRHQNAATGRANRVPDGDRATIDVDPGRVNAQFLVDGTGLGGKGFVQLEQIHVGGVPACAREGLARGRHGPHAHGGRVQTRGSERCNARQRLEAQGGRLFG